MNYSKLRITEKIVIAREAISIALNDSIVAAALLRFGMTPERLADGLQLQETTNNLENKRQVDYGKRLEASAIANDLYIAVRDTFQVDRNIVLAAAKNKAGFKDQLRIAQSTERRRDAFLFQVQAFYNILLENEALRAYLEPYNFTLDILAERIEKVEELAKAMEEQQRMSGIAKAATQRREEALASLDSWMGEFIGAARLAFRQDKSQLERLGL